MKMVLFIFGVCTFASLSFCQEHSVNEDRYAKVVAEKRMKSDQDGATTLAELAEDVEQARSLEALKAAILRWIKRQQAEERIEEEARREAAQIRRPTDTGNQFRQPTEAGNGPGGGQ